MSKQHTTYLVRAVRSDEDDTVTYYVGPFANHHDAELVAERTAAESRTATVETYVESMTNLVPVEVEL